MRSKLKNASHPQARAFGPMVKFIAKAALQLINEIEGRKNYGKNMLTF